MTKPVAIRCCYSDWKLIRTRGVVQLVFEVPLSDADAAYEVIGGMPDPSSERWFAIAPLQAEAAKVVKLPDRREWPNVPPTGQAGMRCNEPAFIAFLQQMHSNYWRETENARQCVHLICGIRSRVELGTDRAALAIWRQLDRQYLAWKLTEQQS